jgi:hypothetical protein
MERAKSEMNISWPAVLDSGFLASETHWSSTAPAADLVLKVDGRVFLAEICEGA